MARRWKTTIFLLLAILLIASFLRLYNLDQTPPGLYADEAMYGNNAIQALDSRSPDGGFKIFYEENNGREGLFINIQAAFIGLVSPIGPIGPIGLLRLPSAIFGILTVLGVFFLTLELFRNSKLEIRNYEVALFASFLMATSFWHLNFSRIGFRAIMAPFFLTWGLYFLIKSYSPRFGGEAGRTNWSNKSYKFNWILPILAGLVYGLGFHSYIAYRATPILILLIIYWIYRSNKSNWSYSAKKNYWLTTSLFLTAAILTALPLGIYFIENPQDFLGRTAQISIFDSPTPLKDLGINILKTLGMFNFVGDHNWRHNIAGNPLLFWPVGILFLVGLAAAIAKTSKTSPERFPAVIILTWLIVAALPVIVSNEGMPHALRAILMAPPVFILAGFGGMWFYEKIKPIRVIKLIGLIGLIALIAVNTYVSYFIVWARQPAVADAFHQRYVEIGRYINSLPKETPKYIVIDTGGHDVRKIGTPAQPIMFITDTFLPSKQKEKNLHYISPEETNLIPPESFVITIN